ncbi:putative Signal transduction histidine kinase,nitrogen specific with PBPb domain [Vibrio nigripulchritudo SO65]|uniref:ATP-binding protein n=1 Tax=Vibrio nigripulchritudo TaxID=28173 RepID=UPI0003B1C75F|nr:transporter substrate-binding domain-containing protein [Vibrio nigripulchritudo]CCN33458.1 putative Signal transduction histidine kinase,nitrogen specific with PBPb domain [Vibrio nigripulchritudo AM115]CCN41469.1 putative Signal transduction histidine kinase,nitrogen specific with PBPb domain [Vibrio nigripulchritudo FTn2]CCN64146.1 putative Signal transduction histidine kinase,nitrogen specific with PBPb domain [Vibrio nigripulchritudo POn4]CCN75788.1 putative Signal transduction histidin
MKFVTYILSLFSILVLSLPIKAELTEEKRYSYTVNIGVLKEDFAPYSTVKKGEVTGLLPSIINEFQFYVNRNIHFVPYDNATDLYDALLKEEVDAITAHGANYRDVALSFTNPIVSSRQIGLSHEQIGFYHELNGRVLSYVRQFGNESYLKDLYPASRLLPSESVSDAIYKVAMEVSDATVGDGLMLYQQLQTGPYADFLSISLFDDLPVQSHFLATKSTNTQLVEEFNRAINSFRRSTRYKEILKNWLDETQERFLLVQNDTLALTEAEQKWLGTHPSVLVVTRGNSKPIDFYSANLGHQGISAEILQEIALITGLKWDYINLQTLNEDELDYHHSNTKPLIHAAASIKQEKYADHLFSRPYMQEPWVVIGRSENYTAGLMFSELDGATIGTVDDTVGVDVIREYCPTCNIKLFKTDDEVLEALDNKQLDNAVMSLFIASPKLQSQYAGQLRVVSMLNKESEVPVSFSVEHDQQLLINIINKALSAIPPSRIQEIQKKWRNANYESGVKTRDVLYGLLSVAGIAGFIILVIMAWNWKLKKEVFNRKKAEEDLKKRVNYERSLLDAIPFPIVVRDANGIIQSTNKAASDLKYLNYLTESLVNNKDEDNLILSGYSLPRLENEVIIDGAEKHYAYWKCPYVTPDHQIDGTVTILDDITELHLTRKRAKDAEQRVQKLADNVIGAVLQHTQSKQNLHSIQFTFVSAGISDLIGIESEQLMVSPRTFFSPMRQKDKKELIKCVRHALDEGFMSQDVGLVIDGEEKWLHIQSKITETEDSYIWNTVLTDITELKQQQKELREARQKAISATEAKSRFLANMSHEIRTPIGGIISLLELCEQYSVVDEVEKIHTSLSQSANNLLHIVNDILDFSKIEAGKLTLSPQPCVFESLIIRITQLQARHAQAKGLKFALWLDPALAYLISIDEVRLGQVLNNLLNNAVKFTEHGTVRLSVSLVEESDQKQTIMMRVIDSGIGIEKDSLKGLFQPFVQADEGTTRKFGGSGLGLTISKQLINQMGGDIAVSSQIGSGSQFKVMLPVDVIERAEELDKSPLQGLIINDFFQSEELCTYLENWNITASRGETHSRDKLDFLISKHQCDLLFISDVDYNQLQLSEEWWKAHHSNVRCLVLSDKGMLSPTPQDNHWLLSSNPIIPSQLKHCIDSDPARNDADLVIENIEDSAPLQTREEAIHSGRLILIAEDHPINRQVIASQLKQLGYHADIFVDGKEAYDAFQKQNYGLIITDCHMPEMDGYALTKAIRKLESQESLIRTPIIALTANAIQGEREKCLELGMDDFLSKPTKMPVMDEAIARLLPPVIDPPNIDLEQRENEEEPELDFGFLDFSDTELQESTKPEHTVSLQSDDGASEMIDVQKVCDIFGDMEIAKQIIKEFITSQNKDMDELNSVLSRNSHADIKQVTHRMKGAARMLECQPLSEALARFEEAADKEDEHLYSELFSEVSRLTVRLNESELA